MGIPKLLLALLAKLGINVAKKAEFIVAHLRERVDISPACHHEDAESSPASEERYGFLTKDCCNKPVDLTRRGQRIGAISV